MKTKIDRPERANRPGAVDLGFRDGSSRSGSEHGAGSGVDLGPAAGAMPTRGVDEVAPQSIAFGETARQVLQRHRISQLFGGVWAEQEGDVAGKELRRGSAAAETGVVQRTRADLKRVLPKTTNPVEVVNDVGLNPHYRYTLVQLNNRGLEPTHEDYIDPKKVPGLSSEMLKERANEKIEESHYYRNLAQPDRLAWEKQEVVEAPRDVILRRLYESNGFVPLRNKYESDDTLKAFGLTKAVFDAAFMDLWKVEKKVQPSKEPPGLELSRGGKSKLDTSLGESTDVLRNNLRKSQMFEQFRDMMEGLKIPVFLTGGAVAVMDHKSPRAIKDLDFRTTAVPEPFSQRADVVEAINQKVRDKFSKSTLEAFQVDAKNKHSIDGKIDGIEITVARIMNPEDLKPYDKIEGGRISGKDLILDKAATFIFRKDDTKRTTDLFDLLWTMTQVSLSPKGMVELLAGERSQNYGRKTTEDSELAKNIEDEFGSALASFLARGLETIHKLFLAHVRDKSAIHVVEKSLQGLMECFGIKLNAERSGTPTLLIQAGNMTGDMFGVNAAMLLNPYAEVVILSEGTERDKTSSIVAFYRQSIEARRIHVLKTSDSMTDLYTLYAGRTKVALPYARIDPAVPAFLRSPSRQYPVSEATSQTASYWKAKESRSEIKKAWKVDALEGAGGAKKYLESKGIPKKKRYAILWSRFSGKKGGPHAQHDTSFEAMRQMVHLAVSEGYVVLIAGDKPAKSGSAEKFKSMCASGSVYDLTEFWNESAWKSAYPAGERKDQFNFFEYLNEHNGVKHLGFRSGNLEAYALMGHEVRYMEEEGNLQSSRMERWHEAIGYDRILIKGRMPSRTGRFVVADAREKNKESKPPWIEKPDSEKKDAYVKGSLTSEPRGFEVSDLHSIHGYFRDGAEKSDTELVEIDRTLVSDQMADQRFLSFNWERQRRIFRWALSRKKADLPRLRLAARALRAFERATDTLLLRQAMMWGWKQQDLDDAREDWLSYVDSLDHL